MTLIVTFDLLSKNFNMALIFYLKRQCYHIWYVWCIKQDLSDVVINLKHVTFDLLFKNLTLFIIFYTLFITFKPYKEIGLFESSTGFCLSQSIMGQYRVNT